MLALWPLLVTSLWGIALSRSSSDMCAPALALLSGSATELRLYTSRKETREVLRLCPGVDLPAPGVAPSVKEFPEAAKDCRNAGLNTSVTAPLVGSASTSLATSSANSSICARAAAASCAAAAATWLPRAAAEADPAAACGRCCARSSDRSWASSARTFSSSASCSTKALGAVGGSRGSNSTPCAAASRMRTCEAARSSCEAASSISSGSPTTSAVPPDARATSAELSWLTARARCWSGVSAAGLTGVLSGVLKRTPLACGLVKSFPCLYASPACSVAPVILYSFATLRA